MLAETVSPMPRVFFSQKKINKVKCGRISVLVLDFQKRYNTEIKSKLCWCARKELRQDCRRGPFWAAS